MRKYAYKVPFYPFVCCIRAKNKSEARKRIGRMFREYRKAKTWIL